jgi:hypothetical protein
LVIILKIDKLFNITFKHWLLLSILMSLFQLMVGKLWVKSWKGNGRNLS